MAQTDKLNAYVDPWHIPKWQVHINPYIREYLVDKYLVMFNRQMRALFMMEKAQDWIVKEWYRRQLGFSNDYVMIFRIPERVYPKSQEQSQGQLTKQDCFGTAWITDNGITPRLIFAVRDLIRPDNIKPPKKPRRNDSFEESEIYHLQQMERQASIRAAVEPTVNFIVKQLLEPIQSIKSFQQPRLEDQIEASGWQTINNEDIAIYVNNSSEDFNKEAQLKKGSTWSIESAWKFSHGTEWVGGADYFAHISSGNSEFSTKFNVGTNGMKIKFVTCEFVEPCLKKPKETLQRNLTHWQSLNVKEVDSEIQKLVKKINVATGEAESNIYEPLKAWRIVAVTGFTTKYVWLVADDGSEYTITYNVPKSGNGELSITNIQEGNIEPKK